MTLSDDAAYAALRTHDARLDGRLFVGVTSTGVYCRPVCRVRTPRRENCRFFANAASAEAGGFRPCLRCRPEIAPGLSLADSSQALARHAAVLLDAAAQRGEDPALPAIAARLGVTDRHLRRIFTREHGATPVAYLRTQRLLLAKQLLTDTALPVTQVALATGYASLRRFNAAFAEHYRLSPSALRRERTGAATPEAGRRGDRAGTDGAAAVDTVPTLRLAWRPPYDIAGVLGFFERRAVASVEQVQGLALRRTVALEHRGRVLAGWIEARFVPERNELHLRAAPVLAPALGVLRERVRQCLDLDADPARIDPALVDLASAERPGVRLPGGIDGFEVAVRVILGQQVTLAAARTLTGRLVERFGTRVATPFPGLTQVFPSAHTMAAATPESIGTLGIVRQRVRALQALATEVAAGRIELNRTAPLEQTLDRLRALPGVGEWSTQLIAMRALAWPDAWPASDIGVLKALARRGAPRGGARPDDRPRGRPGDGPARQRRHPASRRAVSGAGAQAEAWRPWRAYAVMRLWLSLEDNP